MKKQQQLETGNSTVFYYTAGEGLPVVLIHGFAEDSTIWNEVTESLQSSFRLIVPDLPGSGKSTILKEGSMESYARVIESILQKEGIDSAVLVGHSMGGYISLAFAELFPQKIKALCLFHSSAYADDEEKITARNKGIEFIRNNGAEKFLAQSIPNLFSEKTRKEKPELVKEIVERYANFNAASLVQYYQAMIARPDRTDILKSIQKPVLFIAGESDTAVPVQKSIEQSTMPAFSYIHICRNSGHMGMLEETAETVAALRHFLEDL